MSPGTFKSLTHLELAFRDEKKALIVFPYEIHLSQKQRSSFSQERLICYHCLIPSPTHA